MKNRTIKGSAIFALIVGVLSQCGWAGFARADSGRDAKDDWYPVYLRHVDLPKNNAANAKTNFSHLLNVIPMEDGETYMLIHYEATAHTTHPGVLTAVKTKDFKTFSGLSFIAAAGVELPANAPLKTRIFPGSMMYPTARRMSGGRIGVMGTWVQPGKKNHGHMTEDIFFYTDDEGETWSYVTYDPGTRAIMPKSPIPWPSRVGGDDENGYAWFTTHNRDDHCGILFTRDNGASWDYRKLEIGANTMETDVVDIGPGADGEDRYVIVIRLTSRGIGLSTTSDFENYDGVHVVCADKVTRHDPQTSYYDRDTGYIHVFAMNRRTGSTHAIVEARAKADDVWSDPADETSWDVRTILDAKRHAVIGGASKSVSRGGLEGNVGTPFRMHDGRPAICFGGFYLPPHNTPQAAFLTRSIERPVGIGTTPATLALKPGEESKLNVFGKGDDYDLSVGNLIEADLSGCEIAFASSDNSVAQVASDGLVFAKGAGLAVVTVTARNADSSFTARVPVIVASERGNKDELRAVLETIRSQYDLPAIAGAIVTSEGVVASAAVGVRKAGTDVAVTIDDKWHLGSNTKAMTATLVAGMVESGRVEWNTRVSEVFPGMLADFHPAFKQVTMRQLLTHQAGLPADIDWKAVSRQGDVHEQRLDVMRSAMSEEPRFEIGKKAVYSNLGYVIAGAVVEKLTDRSWEEAIRKQLFGPLEMDSAGFGGLGTRGEIDQPWPHTAQGRPTPENGPAVDNPPMLGPAGRVHCTLGDWGRFIADQIRGGRGEPALLQAEAYKRMHTPATGTEFGMGWIVRESDGLGGSLLIHAGSNTMNYAYAWVAPQRDLAVLVCINQGGGKAEQASRDAVEALINLYQVQKLMHEKRPTYDQSKSEIGS